MTMDGSPIITTGPLPGMYLNCRLELRGLQGDARRRAGASPGHIASDEPHVLNAPFTLERFHEGRPIDERGAGPTPAALHSMLIPCPVCGLRDQSEFTYGGDATIVRPELADADAARWADYVYDREKPARAAHGILAPRPWLPHVDDRRAQHGDP